MHSEWVAYRVAVRHVLCCIRGPYSVNSRSEENFIRNIRFWESFWNTLEYQRIPPPPLSTSPLSRAACSRSRSARRRPSATGPSTGQSRRRRAGKWVTPSRRQARLLPRGAPPQGQASDRRLQAGGREVGHRLRLGQLGRGGPQDVRQARRRQGRCGGVGGGDAAVSTSDATRGTSLRCAPRTHARGSHARVRVQSYSLYTVGTRVPRVPR